MTIKVNGKVVTCPDCQKDHIWRKGKTPARGGAKVRYVCVDCGRTFAVDEKKVKAKTAVKK